MKVILVTGCGLCPYRTHWDNKCSRTLNPIKDLKQINDDCPLEDEGE